MPDSRDPTADETDAEIRRVCSLLESVAEQYPDGSPESDAIADAAQAFLLVRQHKVLARAYRRLKAAHNGELDDEMIAKLRSVGIDEAELEDTDF
jgi:hypothetical protein